MHPQWGSGAGWPQPQPRSTQSTLNVAVTDWARDIATVQPPVLEQAPLHPANVDPDAGEAVRLTTVPAVKLALHVGPQLIPPGLEVTVPDPVPVFPTLST